MKDFKMKSAEWNTHADRQNEAEFYQYKCYKEELFVK